MGYKGLHDISYYTLSTYAFSTAHNFNLLHFQPSAISTYANFGYLLLIRFHEESKRYQNSRKN